MTFKEFYTKWVKVKKSNGEVVSFSDLSVQERERSMKELQIIDLAAKHNIPPFVRVFKRDVGYHIVPNPIIQDLLNE